jgi:hypothetical protein
MFMALIDIQPSDRAGRNIPTIGPRQDWLGFGLFVVHAFVGFCVFFGWALPSRDGLGLYLVLLPAMALQWRLNRGSCVLNNLESRLRSGKWRDPANREEGAFLLMVSDWLFRTRPSALSLDRLSYAAVLVLWLLGAAHLAVLTMA